RDTIYFPAVPYAAFMPKTVENKCFRIKYLHPHHYRHRDDHAKLCTPNGTSWETASDPRTTVWRARPTRQPQLALPLSPMHAVDLPVVSTTYYPVRPHSPSKP